MMKLAKLAEKLHLKSPERDCTDSDVLRLKEVHKDDNLEAEPDPDVVYYVDVHDRTGVTTAIECSQRLFRPRPGERISATPQLFALVDFDRLEPLEKRQINMELIPAGASVFRYPDGCESLEQAIDALRNELIEAQQRYAEARASLRKSREVNRKVTATTAEASSTAGTFSAR